MSKRERSSLLDRNNSDDMCVPAPTESGLLHPLPRQGSSAGDGALQTSTTKTLPVSEIKATRKRPPAQSRAGQTRPSRCRSVSNVLAQDPQCSSTPTNIFTGNAWLYYTGSESCPEAIDTIPEESCTIPDSRALAGSPSAAVAESRLDRPEHSPDGFSEPPKKLFIGIADPEKDWKFTRGWGIAAHPSLQGFFD